MRRLPEITFRERLNLYCPVANARIERPRTTRGQAVAAGRFELLSKGLWEIESVQNF
jgi:hypothetical protein